MEEKNVFTLNELIERMKPQSRADKAVIRDCVEGLGVYAALTAVGSNSEYKTKDIRSMVDTLVSYWCLGEEADGKTHAEFMQEFDDRVDTAIRSGGIDADLYEACANTLTGIARYGEDLYVAHGNDAMEEMLKIAELLEEIGEYFGYTQELEFAQGSAKWLRNTVAGMLAEYKLETKPLIRFIDSEYRELFKIPDGESIRITYPPDDGREPVERECKHLGEMHVQIGSTVYHICEFAERMESLGAKYEPVNQLHNVEILPPADGENKFFEYNREEGNSCTGSLHGNFGNDGERFTANWNERDNGLYNGEMQSELQAVVYALRQDILKDRASMLAYCENNPDAKLSGGTASNGREYGIYGFKLETESRQYFVRCYAEGKDSHFAIFAYADKPALMLAQSQKAPIQEANTAHVQVERGSKSPVVGATSKDAEKPSVLDEIRESRSAPKPPPKSKPEKSKETPSKKKNQTEL